MTWPPGATRAHLPSPVGELSIVVDGDGALACLAFEEDATIAALAPSSRADPVLRQLDAYFAGRRRSFDLPLQPAGTAFQRRVWDALLTIPYGETLSYGALAARLGQGAHPRAVGTANARNPVPIVIPCHRVIGADGRLTGYGGGLERKRRLLALEGAVWRE